MRTDTLPAALRCLRDALATDAELLERFVRRRDPSAFELLVWRHGRMVSGVCRRVLGDAHAAEDAFQAAFLILATKAHKVRAGGSLAPWLHRVACSAALDARRAAARRAARERPLADAPSPRPGPADEAAGRELRAALDAEVARLPEKYRVAFIFCVLEGASSQEAARALGCAVGTVESRLARARARLRRALRQEVAAPAGAAPAAGQVAEVVRAAVAGAVPARVAPLVQGVLQAMFWSQVKLCAAVLLAVGVAGTGAGWLAHPAGARDGAVARLAPAPAAAPKEAAVRKALAEAVKEAEASEVEEKYPTFKVNVLVRVARAQHAAGDKAGAAKTFALAVGAAKEVESDEWRGDSYGVIAQGQAATGDVKGALATLAAYKVGPGKRETNYFRIPRSKALQAVAIAQAKAGDFKGALKTVESINDPPVVPNPKTTPLSVFHAVAEAQREGWWAVALEQARAKDAKGALATAQRIKGERNRIYALMDVAAAQAKAGDKGAAAATRKQAVAALAEIEDEHYLLHDEPPGFIVAWVEAGGEKEARAWIAKRKSPALKATALVGLAAGLAKKAKE